MRAPTAPILDTLVAPALRFSTCASSSDKGSAALVSFSEHKGNS